MPTIDKASVRIELKGILSFLAMSMPSLASGGELSVAAENADVLRFSSTESVLSGEVSVIRLSIGPDGNHQLWGEPQGQENGGLNIRQRHKSGTGWDDPQDVPFNTQWNEFDPAFTPDGSGVYFFSNRPGGEGGDDIWFVPVKSDGWGEPVNIGPPVNTPSNEWAPTPLADGRLMFSSDGHAGFGGQDLYIAEQNSGGWSVPQNLGSPVNSDADDYDAVFLDEDALVFTRSEDPESGSDLYYSCRLRGAFTEPRSAGPNVNLGGGWALGPSVSDLHPGVLFFSGRDPNESNTRIYRVQYEGDCSAR
jgi:hypothetical protein